MSKKQKQLLIALGIGLLAVFFNKTYLDSVRQKYQSKKTVEVVRAKKQIRAGTVLSRSMVEKVKVPQKYAPRASIKWGRIDEFLEQELTVDVIAEDYLLQSYFRAIRSGGNTLSEQLEGQDLRAISLPVDETNSLARSIVTGDKIDLVFTFNSPRTRKRVSMVLLQNVSVIATGAYTQELPGRSGRVQRYNTLTLRLNARDALRLNYARQEGKVSILLRNARDNSVLDMSPIASVVDLLDSEDKTMLENVEKQQIKTTQVEGEQFKEQVKALMEMQRKQQVRRK